MTALQPVAHIPFAVPDINDDDVQMVTDVLRSGWITTGEHCQLLEDELAEYLGVPHVVAMASCTAALETAYAFLALPPGARVGVPAWTFASTALAPAHHGAEVVLLDVEDSTLMLSVPAVQRALDDGLDAIVGVHFAGIPLRDELHRLCRTAGIPLIEDAAHALGAIDSRGRVGGQGTAGAAFSFYATKNLTSGEGGALATDDPALADFARSFRLHGMSRDAWRRYRPREQPVYDLTVPGIKANLPDLLAALARSQLRRFDEMQAVRRKAVERYRAQLADTEVTLVPDTLDPNGADHLLVVLLPEGVDRAAVIANLSAVGVGTSIHFRPLHHLTWFREHATIGRGGLPNTERASGRALSLPLHSRTTIGDVDRACDELVKAIR